MSLDIYLHTPCDHCKNSVQNYSGNVTHNLGKMAREAGVYDYLWEAEGSKARDLIEPLRAGLALLQSDPPRFAQHNAENGWGTYIQFLPFVAEVLAACEANPDADVTVSR